MSNEANKLHRRIDKLDSFFLWVSSLSGLGFSVFITYLKTPIGPYIPIFALIAYSIAVGYVSGAISLDSFTERIRGWSYLTLGLSLYVPLTIMKIGESQLQDLLGSMRNVAYLQMGLGLAIPLAIAFLYNRFAVGGIYRSFKQPREEVTNTILWRSTIASFYLGSLLYISILALYNENIDLLNSLLYTCFILIFLIPLVNEEKAMRGLLKLETHQNYVKVEKKLNTKRWGTSMALLVIGVIAFFVQFQLLPPYIPLTVWAALFFLSISLPSIGLVIMLFFAQAKYTFTLKAKAKKELSEDNYRELQDLVKRVSGARTQKNAKHERKKEKNAVEQYAKSVRKVQLESSIVEFWLRIFSFLKSMTLYHILKRFVPSIEDADNTDRYVSGWMLLSIASLVVCSAPNLEWWELIILCWGTWRVFAIITIQINLLLFDEYREMKAGKPYRIRGFRRLIILLLQNYVEVIFWFAVLYRNMNWGLATIGVNVDSFLVSLNFSFVTMTSFGHSSVFPQEGTPAWILMLVQSAIGIFMALLVLSRFVSLIPKPKSELKEEGQEVRAHTKEKN